MTGRGGAAGGGGLMGRLAVAGRGGWRRWVGWGGCIGDTRAGGTTPWHAAHTCAGCIAVDLDGERSIGCWCCAEPVLGPSRLTPVSLGQVKGPRVVLC